jgi:hypothetical protein
MSIFNKQHRRKIIIVIHGLANKPPKDLLEKWCNISIREGLNTIHKHWVPFTLKLAYWADLMHEKPQDLREHDKKSDTYLDDPYTRGNPEDYNNFKPSKIKEKVLDKLEKKLDKIYFEENRFINIDSIANILIRNLFKDLDYYYHHDCPVARYSGLPARDAIRSRLAEVLGMYHNRDILLIAHSMGTIISYDVLTRTMKDVSINTLITIGSPLAMPLILKKILLEQGIDFKKEQQPLTPENIMNGWYNFSDLDDPVAINYNLADDYRPNSRGIVPKDVVIYNNYMNEGNRSPHKLYGYLRAPEVANVIYDFCIAGRSAFIISLRQKLGKIFGR